MDLFKRMGITLFFLVLYFFGAQIPLPGLSVAALESPLIHQGGGLGIFALGYMPFISGFLIVELLALFIPPLKRFRNGGIRGRHSLNKAALIASLFISVLQGVFIVQSLTKMSTQGLSSVVNDPGMMTSLVILVSLVAGSFLVYLVAQLITRYGFGNGFVILVLYSEVLSIWNVHWQFLSDLNVPLFGVFFLVVGYLIKLFLDHSREKPIVPQSVMPLQFSVSILMIPITIQTMTGQEFLPQLRMGTSFYLVAYLAFVLLFSLWGQKLLCPEKTSFFPSFKNIFWKIIFILMLLKLFLNRPELGEGQFTVLQFFIITAMLFDFWSEFSFRNKHPKIEPILELDNVYLAHQLGEKLAKNNIPHNIQSLRFRGLYFIFEPLIKMQILVPQDQAEKALALIEPNTITKV